MTNGLFKMVPVERLVIDEASQIKIFDFMVRFVFRYSIVVSSQSFFLFLTACFRTVFRTKKSLLFR